MLTYTISQDLDHSKKYPKSLAQCTAQLRLACLPLIKSAICKGISSKANSLAKVITSPVILYPTPLCALWKRGKLKVGRILREAECS